MSGELKVNRLGKAYREWRSEWLRVGSWLGLPFRAHAEHWVLKDISFAVGPGEAVGIIGQNGAGKSTLLKLITGTSRPTEGNVWVKGRVAAILELGMGFNVDLTGRQNAYHAAGLMGFSESQISGVIGEIEAFAEIGEYFDEPVRTYSSGMQMRVAFSVATAFRPDLLIIDEALSVGDAYFVHKCFRRIREFRDAGTTLLFVSHDPTAVQSLCDRAVLIDRGRLVLDADPQQVFDYYNALIAEKENSTVRTERTGQGQIATESGTGEVEFESLRMENAAGEAVEYVTVGEPVRLRAKVRANQAVERLVFGYMIRDRLGQPIFGTNTHHTGQVCSDLAAGESVEYEVAFPMNLGTGTYSVSVALSSTETHLVKNYQWKDLALIFTVANVDCAPFVGVAWLPSKIQVLGR
ncbi:ABC transporter ATP-binding protein [Lysobacter enzymogenes]|jgi:lipopolysaccharide transport system ATP-binding protein|uniref:ABC transporter ATP-binding protein n=1 Tax=Lysobacter enzymogenes TaxID=69 RepID=UPI0008967D28|nr:ABC transporter ATP-binding protein [Lysobacter enzymogenes]SDW23116.1 lipopolysaccharide transport system ATP-binding protein [Lysobacter enzymogenes]